MASDYIYIRFSSTLLCWVCTGLTSFLTSLPLQMFLLLSLVHQRNLPLFHLHYKEVKLYFSLLLVVYTGYSHRLLRFTTKCFYPSLRWSPFVTCSISNMNQVKFRHRSNHRECNIKNSINWHTHETNTLQPTVLLTELHQSCIINI
jgi:hypothetical protein